MPVPSPLSLSATFPPAPSQALTPRASLPAAAPRVRASAATVSTPESRADSLLQFLTSGLAHINTLSLYIGHTHTPRSRTREREHTRKNPTRPGAGAGNRHHRLAVSPAPGRRPENPGQSMLPAWPDIRTLVRVPAFGSRSPGAPLRAVAAANFSEINKPVWIKQEPT